MASASIHATAVAIGGEALLIAGPSRAGKSRLALALIGRSTPERLIALIGDDRILLCRDAHGVVARPHPRIAGFLERRGLGIVAMDFIAEAPVGGLIELLVADRNRSISSSGDGGERDLPTLILSPAKADADSVLAWWASRGAAGASHPARKLRAGDRTCAKD